MTVLGGPGLHSVGAWLEQLVAESTGKQGRGIIPVDDEPLGPTAAYGGDRLFVCMSLAERRDPALDAGAARLAAAGHPVLQITLHDPVQIGQLFYVWEFATAVAGAMLRVNPFDQPDVEASKIKTRALTDAFEKTGALPAASPFFRSEGVALYADGRNQAALGTAGSLKEYLLAHLRRLREGDYFALLAYLEHTAAHAAVLRSMREALRDRTGAATCVGFGPRFLHSTGQAYKGGPASGVFLQITTDDPLDLAIPGRRASFGVVKAAQAAGDLGVLDERGRRALRVHLEDADAGLRALERALHSALAAAR